MGILCRVVGSLGLCACLTTGLAQAVEITLLHDQEAALQLELLDQFGDPIAAAPQGECSAQSGGLSENSGPLTLYTASHIGLDQVQAEALGLSTVVDLRILGRRILRLAWVQGRSWTVLDDVGTIDDEENTTRVEGLDPRVDVHLVPTPHGDG